MRLKDLKVHGVVTGRYPNPPSFEELFGLTREQMEFECLPPWLQKQVDNVGYGSEVVGCLIGMHKSALHSAILAALRESEVERLETKKKAQTAGLTARSTEQTLATDALAVKVQGYRRAEEFKGTSLTNIQLDACAKFKIGKSQYHNLLKRKPSQ